MLSCQYSGLVGKLLIGYNRGHKGRKNMALFGGWRLTRTGILFVVGVVVLAALVFGGIVLVRQRGDQVRRDEAVKVAEQNLKNDSGVAVAPGAESNDANKATADTNTNADTSANTGTASTNSSAATAPSADQLPKTGPADDFGRIISVTILASSVAFYVASRRTVQQG